LKKAAEKEKDFDQFQSEYSTLKKKMEEIKRQDLLHHKEEIKDILEEEIVSRYYFQSGP